MWYVYVLESLKNHKRYTGFTNNLARRLWEHNNSKKKNSYSFKHRPFILIYSEPYHDKSQAMQREKYFKTGKGREEVRNILNSL